MVDKLKVLSKITRNGKSKFKRDFKDDSFDEEVRHEVYNEINGQRTLVFSQTIKPGPIDTGKPPHVSAGDTQYAKPSSEVILDGTVTDEDSNAVTVKWSQKEGEDVEIKPDALDVTIAKIITPPLEQGVLEKELVFIFDATDEEGHKSKAEAKVIVNAEGKPPIVIPPVEPGQGELIWSSNVQGNWKNGIKRTIKDFEGESSHAVNSQRMNASGDPELEILGDGRAILRNHCKKGKKVYGRLYIGARHYDASLTSTVTFLDDNVDNDSEKLDARHQYRDEIDKNAEDVDVQGGIGSAVKRASVDMGIEVTHGKAEKCGKEVKMTPEIKTGEKFRRRFTVKHDDEKKEIYEKLEVQYPIDTPWRTVMEQTCKDAPDQFFNKAQFLEFSEFWLRDNTIVGKKDGDLAEIMYEDVELRAL